MRQRLIKQVFFIFAILTVVAGCTVMGVEKKPVTTVSPDRGDEFIGPPVAAPSAVEPPRPRHNLSGFPLPYRQGYDDGCKSVEGGIEHKNAQRFAHDANYRTGWQDGYALCAKK